MNLLSIDLKNCHYRAYYFADRKKVLLTDVRFNQTLNGQETEAMRRNPVAFVNWALGNTPETAKDPTPTQPMTAKP